MEEEDTIKNNDEKQDQNNTSGRTTETNNDIKGRYTEVEDNFLSNSNPIEGFEQNEKTVDEKKPEESCNEKTEEKSIKKNGLKNPLYNNKKTYNFKIILIGDIGVGKTSIINRYINNSFTENSEKSTLYKTKKIDIDAETNANLEIWDTAGEERYMSVTRNYYNDSKGAMVIYDLTKKNTFENLDKWIKDLKDYAPKNIVIMVVGNKSDLVYDKIDLGNELDKIKSHFLYSEVSAKSGTNIFLAFENLTLKIIDEKKETELKGEDDVPRKTVMLKKNENDKEKNKMKCTCPIKLSHKK